MVATSPKARPMLACITLVATLAACAGSPVLPTGSQPPPTSPPTISASPAGVTLAPPSATPTASLAPAWTATADMHEARVDDHTATLLRNGQVLVVGGSSAELYDPTTEEWTLTTATSEIRGAHSATLLSDGSVLAAGGNGSGLTSAELYEPDAGTWTATGAMSEGRQGHTATLLLDGRVLVVGGQNGAGEALASAEAYDPATGTWSAAGSLAEARTAATATLLSDGRVLVAGGGSEPGSGPFNSVEIYDPTAGTWTAATSLSVGRRYHGAARLPDGRVLVAGGAPSGDDRTPSVELFDPDSGKWSNGPSLLEPRSQLTAVVLGDGSVLALGGGSTHMGSAERYDPDTGSWAASGPMIEWRASAPSALLADGRVLVVGGFTDNDASASAELYDPAVDGPTATPPPWIERCEPGCKGPIAPGIFTSDGFLAGMQMSFPDDSWFNTADYHDEIQFDSESGSDVLRFWQTARAVSETGELLAEVPGTAVALTDWFVHNSDMVVSTPEQVTVGDGVPATTFTLRISETNVNVDPDCPPGVRSCLNVLWINDGHTFAIGFGEAVRLYLFTVDSGTDMRTIVISIDSHGPSELAIASIAVAPILESLRLPVP